MLWEKIFLTKYIIILKLRGIKKQTETILSGKKIMLIHCVTKYYTICHNVDSEQKPEIYIISTILREDACTHVTWAFKENAFYKKNHFVFSTGYRTTKIS